MLELTYVESEIYWEKLKFVESNMLNKLKYFKINMLELKNFEIKLLKLKYIEFKIC